MSATYLETTKNKEAPDKTAKALQLLGHKDLFISDSTYFYDGGGCC